jgi:WD repeat-containing protein 23
MSIVSRSQIIRVLGLRNRFFVSSSQNQDTEDKHLEIEPNKHGEELMRSGQFGLDSNRSPPIRKSKKLARQVLEREMGRKPYGRERADMALFKQDMIPSSKAELTIEHDSRFYSGQFSHDGNFFFSCCQDFMVRIYDTSNPYEWKYFKSLAMGQHSWTITDATLSKDNSMLAYCSLQPFVCLARSDPQDHSDPRILDLRTSVGGNQESNYFSIYSVRFSGDGREIVAGTGGHHTTDNSIYVYDIERGESILRIPGHHDDVNAVCFGDLSSPHLLYSGSDDGTVKVWDRRSIADLRPSGVFLGHKGGVTYVDSKGDGRYVVSNSKDQTAKLWDLRKVHTPEFAEQQEVNITRRYWNYGYPTAQNRRHTIRSDANDCSVVTFQGHSVHKTLIRCHFSPPGSTDSRYVYSGSYDGRVFIWNLDGTIKATINVAKVSQFLQLRPRIESFWGYGADGDFRTVVRDCSWHPDVPVLAATAWNGWDGNYGTCSVHTWKENADELDKDEPFGRLFDPEMNEVAEFSIPSTNTTPRSRR